MILCKKIISLLLLLIGISYAQNNDTVNVFNPLAIGNRWQLTFEETGRFNIWIEKDTVVNSKRYFLVEGSHGKRVFWERYDTVKIQTLGLDVEDLNRNGRTDDEVLLEDFKNGMFMGYRYVSDEADSLGFFTNGFESETSVFGEKVTMIKFNHPMSWIAYAEKYGYIFEQPDGAPLIINAAIINGVQYGKFVSVKSVKETPEKYSLTNYPNPFNPSTKIKFSLPESDYVKLEIYNLLGEKIAVLINEELESGTYTYDYNSENLTSGVLICRLKVGKNLFTRKLLLIK